MRFQSSFVRFAKHSFSRGEAAIFKGKPLEEATEEKYATKDVSNPIKPCLPENTYVAEIEYYAPGDELQQIDLCIEISGREGIVLTVSKTGNTPKTALVSLYLQVFGNRNKEQGNRCT